MSWRNIFEKKFYLILQICKKGDDKQIGLTGYNNTNYFLLNLKGIKMIKRSMFFLSLSLLSSIAYASSSELDSDSALKIDLSLCYEELGRGDEPAAPLLSADREGFQAVTPISQSSSFSPLGFTFAYNVRPATADNGDFINVSRSFLSFLGSQTDSNVNNIYQNFAIFMKELQEAIVAGANLIQAVSTSEGTVVQVVAEAALENTNVQAADSCVKNIAEDAQEVVAAEAAIQETIVAKEDAINTAEQAVVKAEDVINTIEFEISLFVEKEEDISVWTEAKDLLFSLKQSLEKGLFSPNDLIEKLSSVFGLVEKSGLRGSFTISSKHTN